jgi:preprotein translocase subunit SecD
MIIISIQFQTILKNINQLKIRIMKTIHLQAIAIIFAFFSCNSGNIAKSQKINFGIYETTQLKDVPASVIDSLKKSITKFENKAESSIIGYEEGSNLIDLDKQIKNETVKLVKTFYPIDKEKKYYAIVAIKPKATITNLDIQNTEIKGNDVYIYFNLEGAKKWAEMTKNSVGKNVAFLIDNQVYTLPNVMGEIKGGIAVITGLENETTAKKVAGLLNN